MNKLFKQVTVLLLAIFIVSSLGTVNINAETTGKNIDIMFTHDLHSRLNSFFTSNNGEKVEVGGLARIKTLINEKKNQGSNLLILDGGDFSMGTLIQTVYEEEAAELRMLGSIGYDVTILGNHEYDYRTDGLVSMLTTAINSNSVLPKIVLSNVDWEAMESEGLSEEQKELKEVFDNYGVEDYTVIEKENVKIAVLGIFGNDALECSPTCVLKFKDPIVAAKETVEKIKEKEDVDMIVCVSHSGIWEDEKKSEDELLAKGVPDIDVIVSGHTHTELLEPIKYGNTYIVSSGEYGINLGNISMEQKKDGRWSIKDYELIPVTADIEQDEEIQKEVDSFMESVDNKYLKTFGYTRSEVLASNTIKFSKLDHLEDIHEEHNLGNIIADSYKYAVENSNDFDGIPVDVTVVPSGSIRDTYAIGDITVEDVFNSFSLGIGPDGIPGYPLIDVYITGKELKTAVEIDASITNFMTSARLYMSGLNFSFNPHRLILNKVTDSYLVKDDNSREEIEDDKLYRVVADLYSGQMLSAVTKMSKGILSVVPKYADGTPIEDFEDVIIRENGKELKAWDSIARYMKSFEDNDGDGVSDVPQYYNNKDNRKVVEKSKNIIELVKNPNKYAAMIIGAIGVFILIIIIIILVLKRIMKLIIRKLSLITDTKAN